MPVIAIDANRLNRLLDKTYQPEVLSDALEQIGCDVEDIIELGRYRCPNCQALLEGSLGLEEMRLCEVCGYSSQEPFAQIDSVTVIRLDLLAARPDLFDIGGLARALKGFLKEQTGLPLYEASQGVIEVFVDSALQREESYRPFIRAAVVQMPPLDDADLATIMKLQENLHWGVGRARKLASIGVYDLDTIQGPITYRVIEKEGESFVPLGMSTPLNALQILETHPKGMAYAHLLQEHSSYPLLVDARGQVLSMPPIINSDQTKVKVGTKNLFIDVTGPSEAAVFNSLRVLVCSLIELGGRAQQVTIREPERTLQTPDLEPRSVVIDLERAKAWLGLPLTPSSLISSLERMRLGVSAVEDQPGRFVVSYPSFRSDVRHMVDIFEDLAIGYGYSNIQAALVPTMTVGRARPEEVSSNLLREVLFGLGYSETMSLPLTTEDDHFTRLGLEVPERYPRIGNPKLKALTVVRTHLMTGILQALHANRRRPTPIRLFELDNVVNLDPTAPTGAAEQRRLCFVEMAEGSGFAHARSVVDALARELGADKPVYQPSDHPAFVTGRAASFSASPLEGLIGELDPEVILNFGFDQPVTLVELVVHRIDCL